MGNEQERKRATDELADLQLEETRHRVMQIRGEQQMRATRAMATQQAIEFEARRSAYAATICTHRKGGMGVENILNGNSPNYAVVKHTLSHGETIVVCQRCPKVWRPPDPRLIGRGATAEDRRRHARELQEYRDALAFPTDNSASGSQIFLIQPIAPVEAIAS